MSFGIILVHGYTGSPYDFSPLHSALIETYGHDSVISPCLPGHENNDIRPFDVELFIKTIRISVDSFRSQNREIIFIGHSTGGSLILSYLANDSFSPFALILAETPKKITSDWLSRWEEHTSGKKVFLTYIAHMVSLVNKVGKKAYGNFPVLVLYGENDKLVLPKTVTDWNDENFKGHIRKVIIPSADHHIFFGHGSLITIDVIKRFITDISNAKDNNDTDIIKKLIEVEPEAKAFLSYSPLSSFHMAQSPAGKKVMGIPVEFKPYASTEPVLANLEITTRCNLKCAYCARTLFKIKGKDMPTEMFKRILDLLPHAYRINLVGLGEPLLHPDIADMVETASMQKRRISLVTNAMLLDENMSSDLLSKGLCSIVFSIDSVDQKLISETRRNLNFEQVIKNIKGFMKINQSGKNIPTAVFSAVSIKTVPNLSDMIDIVAEQNIDALMMSDLNFEENIEQTLWKNDSSNVRFLIKSAIVKAFSKNLPVLSVTGLEEFGLSRRYRDYLLLRPNQIMQRQNKHQNCCSPWQTIPVNVDGHVTICDCQPEKIIGNILTEPLSNIWNGQIMTEHRVRLASQNLPSPCLICPRL